jgi:hypothetical protein
VPPARPPSAATPAIRQSHRPLLPGPGGPSSPSWLATAGPAPPPTARCRAPDTAGRYGCRTAARRCDTPGSANRRSAGYTDGRRPAWASSCIRVPCRSPSRAGWRSPRAGGSSGRSRGVTALGLIAGFRPTHQQAGTARSELRRGSTVLPAGRARRARSRCGRRPTPLHPGETGSWGFRSRLPRLRVSSGRQAARFSSGSPGSFWAVRASAPPAKSLPGSIWPASTSGTDPLRQAITGSHRSTGRFVNGCHGDWRFRGQAGP